MAKQFREALSHRSVGWNPDHDTCVLEQNASLKLLLFTLLIWPTFSKHVIPELEAGFIRRIKMLTDKVCFVVFVMIRRFNEQVETCKKYKVTK